mgnify:CR=1 FL=1
MKRHNSKGFMGVPMITLDKEMILRMRRSTAVSQLVEERKTKQDQSNKK